MVKPTPEKIQEELRNFQEYMWKKYDGHVQFMTAPGSLIIGGQEKEISEEHKEIKFDMKPEELLSYLNSYVVKQQDAKEILATKICTHFNRIKLEDKLGKEVGRIKNNILMIGPTGVGKTYIIKLVADKICVPFVKADATKFTEAGYVGGDVEDLVRDLVREANGDIETARYGIIYLDEIDKIAASYSSIGPDVSRTGVQRALLKLMEETEVDVRSPSDPASMMESVAQLIKTGKTKKKKINTKDILFIVSGSFSGLEDIIKKRLHETKIGFNVPKEKSEFESLKQVRYKDLIKYGFEPEFIGRLPVVTLFEELNADDLYTILHNPNSPITLGKKKDFKAYGIDAEFEDVALHKLAELAYGEKTGARGLVSAVEKALLKYEMKLPSTRIKNIRITKEVVENPEAELKKLLATEPIRIATKEIRMYQTDFFEKHKIKIDFTDDALNLLAEKAKNEDAYSICEDLLKDYGLGLKLTCKESFTLTKELLENPKKYLEKLIRENYEPKGIALINNQ